MQPRPCMPRWGLHEASRHFKWGGLRTWSCLVPTPKAFGQRIQSASSMEKHTPDKALNHFLERLPIPQKSQQLTYGNIPPVQDDYKL